jgi:hypothetical protein
MVPISGYYLGTVPPPVNTPTRPMSMSQAPNSRSPPPIPNASNRASMPAPPRHKSMSPPPVSAFINQPSSAAEGQSRTTPFEPTPEEDIGDDDAEEVRLEKTTSLESKSKNRSGTMNKDFKFPAQSFVPPKKAPPPLAPESLVINDPTPVVITPSSVEVPPPPPVEKEQKNSPSVDDGEEDVGPTVEISLN